MSYQNPNLRANEGLSVNTSELLLFGRRRRCSRCRDTVAIARLQARHCRCPSQGWAGGRLGSRGLWCTRLMQELARVQQGSAQGPVVAGPGILLSGLTVE